MVLGLKAVHGVTFIEVLLKKYQLVKEIMLYEIEKGDMESLIPNDLSQAKFPYSFRYYDPIVAII